MSHQTWGMDRMIRMSMYNHCIALASWSTSSKKCSWHDLCASCKVQENGSPSGRPDADKLQSSQMSRGLRSSVRLADMCRHVQTCADGAVQTQTVSNSVAQVAPSCPCWWPLWASHSQISQSVQPALSAAYKQYYEVVWSHFSKTSKPKDVHLLDLKVIAVSFVLQII